MQTEIDRDTMPALPVNPQNRPCTSLCFHSLAVQSDYGNYKCHLRYLARLISHQYVYAYKYFCILALKPLVTENY